MNKNGFTLSEFKKNLLSYTSYRSLTIAQKYNEAKILKAKIRDGADE